MDYKELAQIFKETLTLRWDPVAVRLMRPGEERPPEVIEPSIPLRHCQSIIVARRGNCLYLPPRRHACPDGAGILGLVEMSPKLKSGHLYLLFRKLPTLEIAQAMIKARPSFPAGRFSATLVAPLELATFEPDVVIFTLQPEQAMWLCCAQTYHSGRRQHFNTSGFNSTCADLMIQPMQNGEANISFGCYGARASSEIGDNELYFSLPASQLAATARSLLKLAEKSIPEERKKIYLHPVMDKVDLREEQNGPVTILIDAERCNGCGICVDFCPSAVLTLAETGGKTMARAVGPAACSRCYTCAGQCPERAIKIS